MTDGLFEALIRHTGAVQDRKGWYHFTCPACGKASTPKDYHCSFGYFNGKPIWHCFNCGTSEGLRKLAERVGLDRGEYVAPDYAPIEPKPKTPAKWRSNPDFWLDQIVSHPRRVEAWQAYKPLESSTIEQMFLGVGRLPSSACPHNRLVVPVFDGTMLVGMRGRQITPAVAAAADIEYEGCECGKWTVAGGTDVEDLPLFGEANLKPGMWIFLVENPVDALLIWEIHGDTGVIGLAMYSTSYWRPFMPGNRWYTTITKSNPRAVTLALDNDLGGNGGGSRRREFIRMWQTKRREDWYKNPANAGKAPPAQFPNPTPTASILLGFLKPVVPEIQILDWDGADNTHKADIGTLILQEAQA